MTTKMLLDNQQEKLFTQLIKTINKKSSLNYNQIFQRHTTSHFYNPSKLKIINPFETSDLQNKHKSQDVNNAEDFQELEPQPLKQTKYIVFGNCSPARSSQMGRTFVNLGNNRYLINKVPSPKFSKSDNMFLSNMDLDKGNFNVNNLNFPIISKNSKTPKKLIFTEPQRTTTPKGSSNMKFFSKKKKNRLAISLQVNSRLKALTPQVPAPQTKQKNKTSQQKMQNQIDQNKPIYKIVQIQRRLVRKRKDYLEQLASSKQYEKRLKEIQKSIVLKKKLEKLKQNNKINQSAERYKIQAWKDEITHQIGEDQMYGISDDMQDDNIV